MPTALIQVLSTCAPSATVRHPTGVPGKEPAWCQHAQCIHMGLEWMKFERMQIDFVKIVDIKNKI